MDALRYEVSALIFRILGSMTELVSPSPLAKFADPDWTAKGERRARVSLAGLRTLWINTGSLCNITCLN
jgi:hypothetical protein